MFKKLRDYLKEVKEEQEKEQEEERLRSEEYIDINKRIEEGMLVSEYLEIMKNFDYYNPESTTVFIIKLNYIASEFPNILNEKVKTLYDNKLREQLLSAARANIVARIIEPMKKE